MNNAHNRNVAFNTIIYEGVAFLCCEMRYSILDDYFKEGIDNLSISEILSVLNATLPWSSEFSYRDAFLKDARDVYKRGMFDGLDSEADAHKIKWDAKQDQWKQ